jgi:hypothetical protein
MFSIFKLVHDVPLRTGGSTAFCARRIAAGDVLIIFESINEFIKTVIEQERAGSTEALRELTKLEGVSPEKFRDRVARGPWLLGTWRGLQGGWPSS